MGPLVVLLSLLLHAEKAVPEPPFANRPLLYAGAIGSYRASLEATPTRVEVEQPIRLTLRVQLKRGQALQAPGRPDLSVMEDLQSLFYIETPQPASAHPAENTWEFYYVLRPRSVQVKDLPDIPFYYFDPSVDPNGYQKTYAEGIALTVTEPVRQIEVIPPVPLPAGPASLYRIGEGSTLLRQDTGEVWPGTFFLVLLLVGPPAACLVWWVIWQRLYPDAVRAARQRRSRAARHALKALRTVTQLPPEKQGRQVEQVLTTYLQERMDLTIVEPTPNEVANHLQRNGISEGVRNQIVELYRSCDAFTYGEGTYSAPPSLSKGAGEVILALENEPCLAQRS